MAFKKKKTDKNKKIVSMGYFLTLVAYLLLAPILVVMIAQLKPGPISTYIPVFLYGLGWLKIWLTVEEYKKEVVK